MREYKTRTGKTQYAPSLEDAQEMDENGVGFCLACGEMSQPAEPDAVRYKCDACGEEKVYGYAELAMMGLIK